MDNYLSEFEVNDRQGVAYQQGFDDASKDAGAFTFEVYTYMIFFIVVFAASHIIPSRGRLNDHFI